MAAPPAATSSTEVPPEIDVLVERARQSVAAASECLRCINEAVDKLVALRPCDSLRRRGVCDIVFAVMMGSRGDANVQRECVNTCFRLRQLERPDDDGGSGATKIKREQVSASGPRTTRPSMFPFLVGLRVSPFARTLAIDPTVQFSSDAISYLWGALPEADAARWKRLHAMLGRSAVDLLFDIYQLSWTALAGFDTIRLTLLGLDLENANLIYVAVFAADR